MLNFLLSIHCITGLHLGWTVVLVDCQHRIVASSVTKVIDYCSQLLYLSNCNYNWLPVSEKVIIILDYNYNCMLLHWKRLFFGWNSLRFGNYFDDKDIVIAAVSQVQIVIGWRQHGKGALHTDTGKSVDSEEENRLFDAQDSANDLHHWLPGCQRVTFKTTVYYGNVCTAFVTLSCIFTGSLCSNRKYITSSLITVCIDWMYPDAKRANISRTAISLSIIHGPTACYLLERQEHAAEHVFGQRGIQSGSTHWDVLLWLWRCL